VCQAGRDSAGWNWLASQLCASYQQRKLRWPLPPERRWKVRQPALSAKLLITIRPPQRSDGRSARLTASTRERGMQPGPPMLTASGGVPEYQPCGQLEQHHSRSSTVSTMTHEAELLMVQPTPVQECG